MEIESKIDPIDKDFVLEFTSLRSSITAIEAWQYPDAQDIRAHQEITESEVAAWLKNIPPRKNGQMPSSGLRLMAIRNEFGWPKFPMSKETFLTILEEWRFPLLMLYWSAFQVGGSVVFEVGERDERKINFMIGGGVYPYSIGGIFSYDCRSHTTNGCVISGQAIQTWMNLLGKNFLEIPDPFTVPMLVADVLMNTSINLRTSFIDKIADIELHTGSRATPWRTPSTTSSKPCPGYRELAIDISRANRLLGLSQLSAKRSQLILAFVLECIELREKGTDNLSNFHNTTPILKARVKLMLSSLEYIKMEEQNTPTRLQSQQMVVANLIAQQDVALSMEVARDSRELAAAARRDSSTMSIIAVLGVVFLPGTLVAAFLSLPLFTWDSKRVSDIVSPRLWIYFVIAIPLTMVTVGVFYVWQKLRLPVRSWR